MIRRNVRDERNFAPIERIISRPMDKKALAEFLNLSVRFIETEVKSGRLIGNILGRNKVLFLPHHVDAWLQARPTIAQPPSSTKTDEIH